MISPRRVASPAASAKVKGGRSRPIASSGPIRLEVYRRLPAAFRLDVVGDLLPVVEALEAGALDGADVYEDIFAPAIRLDEAEALLSVEPLYGACCGAALKIDPDRRPFDPSGDF